MWFIKRQQSQICPKKRKKFHTCKITINLQRETKLDFHCFQTRFSIKNLWVEVLKKGFQLCKKNKGPLRERRSSPYFQHIWDFRQFKTKNWFIQFLDISNSCVWEFGIWNSVFLHHLYPCRPNEPEFDVHSVSGLRSLSKNVNLTAKRDWLVLGRHWKSHIFSCASSSTLHSRQWVSEWAEFRTNVAWSLRACFTTVGFGQIP